MKKKADLRRILLIGIPMLLVAIGMKMLDDEARLLWFERNGTDYTRARFYLFSGEKDRAFDVEENEKVRIEWDPQLKKGSLVLVVEPPGGSSDAASGTLRTEQADTISFSNREKGQLKLHIKGVEARGSFEVRWSTKR